MDILLGKQARPGPPKRREPALGAHASRPAGVSVLAAQRPPHAPAGKQRGKFVGDEKARAVAIIALRQQRVVVRQAVPRIGHERQPRGIVRRGDAKARTVHGVIDDRGELMRGEMRREMAQGGGDGGAGRHEGQRFEAHRAEAAPQDAEAERRTQDARFKARRSPFCLC
jgi:hypothetical protein